MLGFNKKTQDASPQENTGGENKVFHFIKTHKKRCIAVVAAAAVLVAVIVPRKSRSASADLAYTQEKLGRRDIVNVYDGSGTINAADSYTVKSLVTGTVLTADFELGDTIQKGDVLYVIDSSDVEGDLESAQLSVSQAQRSYDDAADARNVRTKIGGEVSSFAVAAGDAVQAGQTVATVRDTSVMLLAVDSEMGQQLPGMPGIFRGDQIRLLEHPHRPGSHVLQVPDGSGAQIQGPFIIFHGFRPLSMHNRPGFPGCRSRPDRTCTTGAALPVRAFPL